MIRRVLRGGSFYFDSWLLRSSYRVWDPPENRARNSGFRLIVRGQT